MTARAGSAAVAAERLRRELGPEVVRSRPSDLDAVAADAAAWLPPQRPAAAIRARTVADVQATMRTASALGVPVTIRGAGTGLAGGARPGAGAIVLDLAGMDRILELDPVSRSARVEPGVITARLDQAAAEHGLAFAPDPASARRSTVGGNIATNAGGLRRLKYGDTRQAVRSVSIVLGSGELVRFGAGTAKDVTGLDLRGLVVGSEGALGAIVEARVALIPRPTGERMLLQPCATWAQAQALVENVMASPVTPALLELMDAGPQHARADGWHALGVPRDAAAVLLVQTDGQASADELALLRTRWRATGATEPIELDDDGRRSAMAVRRGEVDAGSEPSWWLGEDMTVPLRALASFCEGASGIAEREHVVLSLIAHAGDGNIHPSLSVRRDGIPESVARDRLWSAADAMVRLALDLGGALTGEHGVGLLKQTWLEAALPPEAVAIQRAIRRLFDPAGVVNPGVAL